MHDLAEVQSLASFDQKSQSDTDADDFKVQHVRVPPLNDGEIGNRVMRWLCQDLSPEKTSEKAEKAELLDDLYLVVHSLAMLAIFFPILGWP